jgi:hypothetical protein
MHASVPTLLWTWLISASQLVTNAARPGEAPVPPPGGAPAAAGVAAGVAAPSQPGDGWTTLEEHWYALELAGAHAGWMRIAVETDGRDLRTSTDQELSLSRGGVTARIALASAFIETRDAAPRSMRLRQEMGQQPVSTVWTFTETGVREVQTQGGAEKVAEHPLPSAGWLTPRAVQAWWLEQREAGAAEITYRTIDGQAGLAPMTVTSRLVGEEVYQSERGPVPVTVWKTTTSLMPGVEAVEWFDVHGVPQRVEVMMPFGRMVTRATSEERAKKRGDVVLAPDVLLSTVVRPDRPFEDAHRATAATLRLRVREGVMPELPQAGAQRVERGDDPRSATVRVALDERQPAAPAELEAAGYRASSVMVDADDELVAKLAARAVRGVSDDPMQKAIALRAYVHNHISRKGMETAFASASETARTRTGDCSEHAVLLCAMLRAQEIPARIATGLVYTDAFAGQHDIFGWHMWTQALIGGNWIDFDATLGNRYNAAHVLTAVSSLDTEAFATDMASMIMLMGNLEIEIVDIQYD